jgi:hypothetical protein
MNVGAVGGLGSGTASVYAALSPFLNGVRRTANDANAAPIQATAAPTSAAATVATAPPFLNPAITQIATLTALGETLHGDGGTLVQSYGAVALLAGPLALTSIVGLPTTPAVPAVAPVTAIPRVPRIETAA